MKRLLQIRIQKKSSLDEVIKGNIDINLKTHIKSDTGLRHLHIVSRIRDLINDQAY